MGRGETTRAAKSPRGCGTARVLPAAIVLAAMIAIGGGGLLLAKTTHSPRSAPKLDAPPTLDATIDDSAVTFPIESLPTLFDLDLTRPASAPVRVARRPEQEPSPRSERTDGLQLIDPAEPLALPVEPTQTPKQSEAKAKTGTDNNADAAIVEKQEPRLEWLPARRKSESKGESESTAQKPSPKETSSSKVSQSFLLPLDKNTAAKPLESRTSAAPKKSADSPPSFAESGTKTAPPQVEAPVRPPLEPLTRNQIYLRNRLRKVVSYYYRRPLNSRDHDAWEAMHGMLAYGLHSRIRSGGPRGEPMTAIGWLCYNNPCKRKQLMRLNDQGEIRAQYGVGLQGHMGQFLAMLAQCNVDRNYPIRVEGREFSIQDLIASEQETCYPNTELTFKLIGLMHYLPSDSEWISDRGENWSIERLIEEELKQPVRGAACGGTHRLAGLSLAARKREFRNEPLDGPFLKARQFTNRYEQYAYRLQNSDGSFSTEWFRGKGRESDINRRCRTSGHILEWLLYHVHERQLESPRVVRGVNYLTNLLYQNSSNEWEVGPLSHALHALALYDQRVFKPHDEATELAQSTAQRGQSASSGSRSASGGRQPRG